MIALVLQKFFEKKSADVHPRHGNLGTSQEQFFRVEGGDQPEKNTPPFSNMLLSSVAPPISTVLIPLQAIF
jgi:hypothetical protein